MPKIVDHEKFKKFILEKCVDIFYEKGYRNVTIKDIARILKISVGSVYYYFPSKKELFYDMYKMLQEQSRKEFHQLLKDCKTPYEKLEKFLYYVLQNPSIVQKQTVLIFDLAREETHSIVKKDVFNFINDFNISIQEEIGVNFHQSQMILTFLAGLMQANFILNNRKLLDIPVREFLNILKKSINKDQL